MVPGRLAAVAVVLALAGCASERWPAPRWDTSEAEGLAHVGTTVLPGQVIVRAVVLEVVAEEKGRAREGPLGAGTLARLAGRDARLVGACAAVTDLDRTVSLEIDELATIASDLHGPGYVGPFG